ncbi:MAG: winged helix-turn-helix transcriptional regulator [Saprospiraceae bacterium]|nr:winged helix-turn-helix transcriptional regulator [Saprospiraceae bacterium]MBK8669284.1 winged helix-turn-helix transcriptional regulator [Saprospiraceae bacterium]MBL0101054.1 winged helix-turn-helix transcriptional regulator [Saprospiraceae bacterium]
MGASKTAHFSDRQNQMASIAKALGHPARIAILEFLTRTDACICGDIVNVLPLSQPTVSQHLKELKDVGLIQGSVEGASICYCVNQKTLTLLKDYIDSMFDSKKCC